VRDIDAEVDEEAAKRGLLIFIGLRFPRLFKSPPDLRPEFS
jgi:hypothetical protein